MKVIVTYRDSNGDSATAEFPDARADRSVDYWWITEAGGERHRFNVASVIDVSDGSLPAAPVESSEPAAPAARITAPKRKGTKREG